MKFSHPLARSGRVWAATTLDDKAHDILVIVTTLELDARHKKFKARSRDCVTRGSSTYATMSPTFVKSCS